MIIYTTLQRGSNTGTKILCC